MIIKNNEEDWAVLIGRWTGVKKGKPGIKGKHTQLSRSTGLLPNIEIL